MGRSLLQSALDGDFAETKTASANITAPAIAESKAKSKGLKIMTFDEFAPAIAESKAKSKGLKIMTFDEFAPAIAESKAKSKGLKIMTFDEFARGIAESKAKSKGLKIMTFDEFARGKNTLEVNLAYRDYLNDSYRSGQIEDVGSLEQIKKLMTESFGAYPIPGLVEDVGRDIAAARGGKRSVRERQASRLAGMVGQVAPRTKQQTASLLSSSQAAPATLLG